MPSERVLRDLAATAQVGEVRSEGGIVPEALALAECLRAIHQGDVLCCTDTLAGC